MYFAVKYFLYKPKCKSKHSIFFFKSLEGILLWTKIWFELLKYRLLLPVLFLYILTLYRWSNKSSEVWLYLTIYQYFYDILFACLMIKPSIISYACVFWNKKKCVYRNTTTNALIGMPFVPMLTLQLIKIVFNQFCKKVSIF